MAGCAVNQVAAPDLTIKNQAQIDTIRSHLTHGDWLVARGIHMPDNLVATVTNMPLSHAAIYDAIRDEVIESDSQGVHTTSLNDFLKKSQRVLIIAPMWANEQTRSAAVERARGWLGKGYNYTGLVGLDFPDRFYCTQLAIDAYKPAIESQAGDNPLPKVIMPGQMYHWGRVIFDTGPLFKAVSLDK